MAGAFPTNSSSEAWRSAHGHTYIERACEDRLLDKHVISCCIYHHEVGPEVWLGGQVHGNDVWWFKFIQPWVKMMFKLGGGFYSRV